MHGKAYNAFLRRYTLNFFLQEDIKMPKTKFQGIVYSLFMSYIMAYGMEVYNTAIEMGYNLKLGGFSTMTNAVLWEAFKETLYMGIIAFILSSLFGNKIGSKFSEKYCNPQKDNPYFCRIMRQAGTVAVMCPTMSLVASILFNIILGSRSWVDLPAIWIGTVLKNFPMAFFWNMFAASGLTRLIFGVVFREKGKNKQKEEEKDMISKQ